MLNNTCDSFFQFKIVFIGLYISSAFMLGDSCMPDFLYLFVLCKVKLIMQNSFQLMCIHV